MSSHSTARALCPFPDCTSNCGDDRRPHVVRHSRLRTRRGVRSRLLCRRCGRTFLPSQGTPYHRMKRPHKALDAAVALAVEGVPLAAIARALGCSDSTVSRWIERAARHAREFEELFARVDQPVELQVDEVRSYGAAREARVWVFNAIEVWSRFWLGSRVGTRTLRNTLLFARVLRSRCRSFAAPVLVTSDEFKYYLPCLRRAFGPACVYVQVKNRYARGRIVRSRSQLKLGNAWTLERARERSEDSKRPNTAYVERLNLHVRRSCAYLQRRTPGPMRRPRRLADALDINRLHYNFVRRHSSLRFGSECRTPAMQAGITKRPLTLREIFSWVPPPSPNPPTRGGLDQPDLDSPDPTTSADQSTVPVSETLRRPPTGSSRILKPFGAANAPTSRSAALRRLGRLLARPGHHRYPIQRREVHVTQLRSVCLFNVAPLILLCSTAFAFTGTFTAKSSAPGGDNNCEVSVSTSGAGALTVTSVTVAGVPLKVGTDYMVDNNGSSTPDILFLPGHEPAAGQDVEVGGTTAGGSGTYSGTVNW